MWEAVASLWLYPRIIFRRSGHNTRMTAANRGDATRLIGRKTDARRTRSYAPSKGLVPTNAPSDRPGRLPERDRLGRLDVAPEQPDRRTHEHDRGGGGRRASDHRLPARFSALDELPRPHMGGYPARDPCRVARAASAGYFAARSAYPPRACFDADRSERAERHAGTIAPFLMPRRPMTVRIGCGVTTGNAALPPPSGMAGSLSSDRRIRSIAGSCAVAVFPRQGVNRGLR